MIGQAIGNFLNDIIFNAVATLIAAMAGILDIMFGTVTTQLLIDPGSIGGGVIGMLQGVSARAVLPVAGVFLTFTFIYELITMISERNNMAQFELERLFWAIFRTALAIILTSSAFEIVLAFIGLGGEMLVAAHGFIDTAAPPFDAAGLEAALRYQAGANPGAGLVLVVVLMLSLLITLGSFVYVIVVVWTRLIMILIYAAVAPMPFAVILSTTWLSEIGKTFLKNLIALAIQSFLIVLILVIFRLILNATDVFTASGNIWITMLSVAAISITSAKLIGQSLQISKSIMGTA